MTGYWSLYRTMEWLRCLLLLGIMDDKLTPINSFNTSDKEVRVYRNIDKNEPQVDLLCINCTVLGYVVNIQNLCWGML